MSLRLKTIWIMALTLTALLLVMGLSLSSILNESYRQIEKQDAQQNQDRAYNALMGLLDNMDRTTQDYSYWDDLYGYMETRDPEFAAVNFVASTFGNTRWSLMVLIDNNGSWAYEGGYDLERSQMITLPEEWRAALKTRLQKLKPPTMKSGVKGLLQVPEGVLLLACREILMSSTEGPSRGLMITGRLLTDQENQRLAQQTRLDLTLRTPSEAAADASLSGLIQSLSNDRHRTLKLLSNDQLIAVERLHDLDAKPALYLVLHLPRTVYLQGQKSLNYLLLAVVICGTIFAGMVVWLLEHFVLSRMSRLTSEVVSLGETQDLSRRITAEGRDEIGLLSDSINRLLKSHEDLHVLLEVEKGKSERLLHNILPDQIADKLKENCGVIAESFPEVSILFADIVDFTTMSTRVSPEDLVNLLNDVFSAFDKLAEKHGLEKIKTIGDAYMVVGGLPEKRSDHAEAIARMAIDMLAALQSISARRAQNLSVRIGINTGPVVAGVIGTKKFLYDLWGDTVNTASRMESSGAAGKIQVTASTYERLKDSFHFEDLGEKDIKGKGRVRVYILIGEQANIKAA